MAISERKKKILAAVVDEYIRTAEPVGSKVIAENAGLGCSSATIRNELAELVNMGYLEQPHTSAGRVPTPMGDGSQRLALMEICIFLPPPASARSAGFFIVFRNAAKLTGEGRKANQIGNGHQAVGDLG